MTNCLIIFIIKRFVSKILIMEILNKTWLMLQMFKLFADILKKLINWYTLLAYWSFYWCN